MANRLKNFLFLFINKAQGAFVEGRKIGDNILMCNELLHNYHKNIRKLKKCAIKIDLFKAYDMVNWNFILAILKNIGIHPMFLNWVNECITTLSFSIIINGELEGFFKSSRGLRQGDPISPTSL